MSKYFNPGQDPAFPINVEQQDKYGCREIESYLGISQRLYIATLIAQGFIAFRGSKGGIEEIDLVQTSYEIADELLKQENRDYMAEYKNKKL